MRTHFKGIFAAYPYNILYNVYGYGRGIPTTVKYKGGYLTYQRLLLCIPVYI